MGPALSSRSRSSSSSRPQSSPGTALPPVAILSFGAYSIALVLLPGMLWVRLLRDRRGHLAEEAALGFAAGSCLQVAAYLVARAVGLPGPFRWPTLTLVAFVARPALRRI